MSAKTKSREPTPSILERRGFFWWHEEILPDQVLAPDSSVAGLLRIENNGRATLELDAYLPNPRGPFAGMAGEPAAGCIQGIVKGSNERVLLCNILRTGGRFSSNGISFERYRTLPAWLNFMGCRKAGTTVYHAKHSIDWI
jgi:hypothetical protein